jgi:serine/threonine-protein kinase
MRRRYRLVARLEQRALSEWFRGAAEGAAGTKVLIELFSPKASARAHAEALQLFAARTRALGSPRALGFDEVGFVHGRLVAVRPLLEGYHLDDALRRLQSKEVVLPPALALWIVAEVAQAVALAHRAGFVHGALAPACIFLSNDGAVSVAEFGGLQAMAASPALAPMAAKAPHGYRAPEIKSALAATAASDVYALGAIAYELLTLKSVASARGGVLSTKRDALAAPSRLDRRINARIDPPIMRALETAPARRPATASEFADALRSAFAALGVAPGAAELARFVRELFPTEVSVGAGSSDSLPFPETFELEVVGGAGPGAPAPPPAQPIASQDEGIFKTQPDLPRLEAEGPRAWAPQGGADALEWDAPPGAMEATHRSLRGAQRRGGPLGVASPPGAQAPRSEASSRGSSPAGAYVARGGAAASLGRGPVRKTEADWHLPPGEPPEPSRPRTGRTVWALGGLALAGLVGLLALSQGRGLHKGGEGETQAPASAARNPGPEPAAAAAAPLEPVRPPGSLSLRTDTPAAVFIDGADTGRTTPLTRHALAPGEHTVLLVDAATGATREFRVRISSGLEEKRVEKLAAGAKR